MDLHTTASAIPDRVANFLNDRVKKPLLRISTAGNVDDGKSTLIGRLLHDSKNLFDDHLAAISTGDHIDFAKITDGLKDEQDQGITIDVAYRYFATPHRTFILADTPGHIQYTRNMATGASTADAAIILIDAAQGITTQTKRHSFIAHLLGVEYFVIAVNKMDLVGYDEGIFQEIRAAYSRMATSIGIKNLSFIPISALKGDNIVYKSDKMPFFQGRPLLSTLEAIETTSMNPRTSSRLPIQFISRPHQYFRGYAGTLHGSPLSIGDAIQILPSRQTSHIKTIETYEGAIPKAQQGQAITVTLQDELDISRGDMMTSVNQPPTVSTQFAAILIWMGESYHQGIEYIVKLNSREVKGKIKTIHHRVDLDTLEPTPPDRISLNDIIKVCLETNQPVVFDPYTLNRSTGSFILIDPVTWETAAAGLALPAPMKPEAEPIPRIIKKSALNKKVRERLIGQQTKYLSISSGQLKDRETATAWIDLLLSEGWTIISPEIKGFMRKPGRLVID